MNADTSWWKNEWISVSPTQYSQYCALLVNLFVTLRQSDSSVEEKMWIIELKSANYLLETEKMLYCTH